MLRRVAFIRAAQTVGLSLAEVRTALAKLPDERTPNKADWNKVSATWIRHVTSGSPNLSSCAPR